jgi:hypothetical protein
VDSGFVDFSDSFWIMGYREKNFDKIIIWLIEKNTQHFYFINMINMVEFV